MPAADPVQAAPPPPAFQLRIDLVGSKPPVWRRVVVPSEFTFDELHQVITIVFDRQEADPHEFEVNGERIGDPASREDPLGILGRALDGKRARLHEPLGPVGTGFRYVCAVDEGHEHRVRVEAVVREHDPQWAGLPVLIAGARAVPRQSGTGSKIGPSGRFDVAAMDEALASLRKRWARKQRSTRSGR